MTRFRLTRQYDQMDCGPACVRMIGEHYGKRYPLAQLRSSAYLTRQGVSVAGIRSAMESIGLYAKSFQLTVTQLKEKCPLPAVLHWDQKHFVVLYAIRKSNGKHPRYCLADPAFGKHSLKESEFLRHWLNGEKGVVIASSPTEKFYQLNPPAEDRGLLFFIKHYVVPFRRELFQLGIGMLSGLLLSLVAPFLSQAMIDNGIQQRDLGIIINLMIAQLCLFVGSFSIGLLRSWVTLYVGTKVNIHILHDFLAKMLRLPVPFFDTKSTGDYQQRISDHYRLENFATSTSLSTFFSLISGTIYLVIIGFYDWRILLLYLFFTALSTGWMMLFLERRKTLDYEQFQLRVENQNAIYEMVDGIHDIKLNGFGKSCLNHWRQMQHRLYRKSMETLRTNQWQGTGYTFLNQLRNIIITFVVALAVVNGEITLGMMVSITYIIGQVNGPLEQLIGFVQSVQDARISLERSYEIHQSRDEDCHNDYRLLPATTEKLQLDHVSFRYAGPESPLVLKDINLEIPCGQVTAIVGESGSGKTTLLKLLLKYYPPTEGNILLGGTPLENFPAEQWREQCGAVMQENFLFSASLKENVILGNPYDRQKLGETLRITCLDKYVDGLPLGTETKVGAEGNGLSGGERQRLMIARAVYRDPQYLFLDEATSSLDAENEYDIVHNLETFFHGRTVVVIAHRLSTVRHAHRIVVLKKGEIAEQGTHEELVAAKGAYYNLVKNQLELAKS